MAESSSVAVRDDHNVSAGFGNVASFEFAQRVAKALAASTLVPAQFRSVITKGYGKSEKVTENPSSISNCIIALDMANRMRADVLMVMQNLYVVEGRPAWSAQFVVAMVNSCGRFSPLRFEISEPGDERQVTYEETVYIEGNRTIRKATCKIKERSCRSWAVELATGERLDGPEVSMAMAEAEGWIGKKGSKWQTMPEVMLRYRAASFFGRLYAPELLMGLVTAEEAHEMIDVTPLPPAAEKGWEEVKVSPASKLEAFAANDEAHADPEPEEHDPQTGEIIEQEAAVVSASEQEPEPTPAPSSAPEPIASDMPTIPAEFDRRPMDARIADALAALRACKTVAEFEAAEKAIPKAVRQQFSLVDEDAVLRMPVFDGKGRK